MDAAAFFARLFGRASGDPHFVITSLVRRAHLFTVGECAEAAQHAMRLSEARLEAYFGLGLLSEAGVKAGRGKASDIVAIPGAWLDIDCQAPYRKKELNGLSLPATRDEALELIVELPDERLPTVIVDSGSGLHAYWLLDTPWVLTNADERKEARAMVETVQQTVRDIAGRRGWHVDNTSDLTRILRVPGTMNWKAGKAVQVILAGGRPLDLAAWGRAPAGVAVPSAALPFAAPTAASAPSAPSPGPAKPRRQLPEGKTLVGYVRECLSRTREDKDLHKAAKALIEGKPFAPAGDRDNKLNALANAAAYYAVEIKPDVEPVELLPLFETSIAAMTTPNFDPRNPPPTMETVEEKLSRAIPDTLAMQEEKWRREDALKAGMVRSIMKSNEASSGFVNLTTGRTEAELAQGYTEEYIELFADDQKCSVKEWRHRWVIQYGTTYWVWIAGRYSKPQPQGSVELVMRKWLAPAHLEWTTPTAKGGLRDKKLPEVLRDYGSGAVGVEGHLDLPRSYYDGETGIFHEAFGVLRDLEPVYDERVDTWLRMLGGAEAETVLDWLATVTDLSYQSGALHLIGPSDTGKSLFANGLAKLWVKNGGPTPLANALGNFNDGLVDCPLVVADEKLPGSGKGLTAQIRSLLGNSGRTINRKYLASAKVQGCVRLILCANNGRMLVDPTEELDHDDLEAFGGRIIFVETTLAAREYLRSLGGTEVVNVWIQDDIIAKHALWLRDNRKVVRGKRFLVEGKITARTRALATSGGTMAAICDWLVNYILRPQLVMGIVNGGVVVGENRYMVTTSAVCESWQHYVKYGHIPTTTAVGRQLKNLSTDTRRIRLKGKQHVVHNIDVEQILEWAGRAGFDVQELRQRLARPLDASIEQEVLDV